ncbi:hypothetical protein [Leptospira noguchii]
MYRVTAFDTPNVSNPCNTKAADVFSPGISLKKSFRKNFLFWGQYYV